MRSDLELGLTAWALGHVASCLRNGSMRLDVSQRDASTRFLEMNDIDRREIEEVGRKARVNGCVMYYTEQLRDNGFGAHWVYTQLGSNWSSLEGTIPATGEGGSRYFQGPQSRFTSSIDCALFLATQMDVGRIQGDVVPLPRLLDLPVPAFLLRYIVSQPLGRYSHRQLNDVKDSLWHVFHDHQNRHDKTSVGNFNDVFPELLRGLPQVSWHTVEATMCCDGILNTRTSAPRYHNSITIRLDQGCSFQLALKDAMLQYEAYTDKCSWKQECRQRGGMYKTTVVDRLPPRLLICFEPRVPFDRASEAGVFTSVAVQYRSLTGVEALDYSLIGMVYRTPNYELKARWCYDEGRMLQFQRGVVDYAAFDDFPKGNTIATNWFIGMVVLQQDGDSTPSE